MAVVKKVQKDAEVNVEVKVEEVTVPEEVEVDVQEDVDTTPLTEEVPEVEVEIEAQEDLVQIDEEAITVDNAKMADNSVKIRMKQDHKCYIGGEFYELKKDQYHVVPLSVKKRLNKAGLLSPL